MARSKARIFLLSTGLFCTLVAAGLACDPGPTGDDAGASTGPAATPPPAPAENDAAFTVTAPEWSLIGNDLTEGDDAIDIEVVTESDVAFIDAWLAGADPIRMTNDEGTFKGSIDVSDLAAGELSLILAADEGAEAFAEVKVMRSHPLYVLVGTDWDDADTSNTALTLQDDLHAFYPELKITHFVGPYTFTDPALDDERVQYLVDWLMGMEEDFGDEVGVHIHPYCNFVETTDVTCRSEPSVVYDQGDPTGYTVDSSSYTTEEYTELLLATDALFEAHGFAKPVSFRAGAWTADMSTLLAVEAAGYTVDSNAYNWARMEEWIGLGNGGFYEWVSENWSTFGDESQPYYPSREDIQLRGDPALNVLEIPLNGAMVDYVSGDEMIEIFALNWDGGALSEPSTYVIGYHPSNYVASYQTEMVEALDHVDAFAYSGDFGPVVYANFRDMTQVFQAP